MIEFATDREQPRTVFPTADDTITAQHMAEDLDLSPQKPNPSITTSSDGCDKEVTENKEPLQPGP